LGIFEGVIAGLILAGGSFVAGRFWQKRKFTQDADATVIAYARQLSSLIKRADPQSSTWLTDSRSIVSARDSLRKTLIALADLLNSDIDTLAGLVDTRLGGDINADEGKRALRVLKETWPTKEAAIPEQVRKLQTELGLRPAK
jgi:hypothetical protein